MLNTWNRQAELFQAATEHLVKLMMIVLKGGFHVLVPFLTLSILMMHCNQFYAFSYFIILLPLINCYQLI